MDIEDNADAIRIKSSLSLLLKRLSTLLIILTEKIELWAEEVLIAYTHLQPAEPSTLGYRIACYTQDLWLDWQNLSSLYTTI